MDFIKIYLINMLLKLLGEHVLAVVENYDILLSAGNNNLLFLVILLLCRNTCIGIRPFQHL